MKVLLIEDEAPATLRLSKLLLELEPNCTIVGALDEIEASVKWLQDNPAPDLIFMDIHLADGYSFAIFDEIKIVSKVIFVTAYDQYALKAFEVNGLDYLLKPIKKEELERSIARFKAVVSPKEIDYQAISAIMSRKEKLFKERFLIKSGDQLNFVRVTEIAYFLSEASYSFLVTKSGNRYILDSTMDQIEQELNPDLFFRVNRRQIIGLESIAKISSFINNRLKIELVPADNSDCIVSRNRVGQFKEWLNQ
jgi:DNA-binding LytR/AlgR family response regulator